MSGALTAAQRQVLILLGAALALVILAAWVVSSRQGADSASGDLVLRGAENVLDKVSEVRLIRGDGTHTTIKPGSAGWNVVERDYPADTGKVRKLLFDLHSLSVVEEKTSVAASYPALGVEDVKDNPKATGTRVELVTPAKTFALIIGKASSGGKSGFVRVADSKQSYLAAPSLTVDADPKRWLDPTLIDLPLERVKAVDVKLADGPAYTASRDKKEQPDFAVTGIPKGRQLTSPGVADPIASSLAGLSLDDAHKAPATPDPKLSQVAFHSFDGLDVTVSGHKDGQRTLITLAVHGSGKDAEAEAKTLGDRVTGWEFEIPSYKYDSMFKPLDDLLAKPPEPAKKPDSKADKGKTAKPDAKAGSKADVKP
jgi:hypothetical protein